MRNSSWKGWFGAEVGFSIYIHRRGFTSTTTNSHQPSLLPLPRRVGARTGERAHTPRAHPTRRLYARTLRAHLTRAPYARSLTRATYASNLTRFPTRFLTRALPRAPYPACALHLVFPRSASSHQHAGQAHHAGVLHPLVAGSISAPAGRCGVRGPKRSPVARAVASRHTQTTPRGSRSPRPRPRGSRGPGAGPPQPRVRRLIRGPVPGAKDATVG